ncbi:MAG: methyltransferase domain-containing protein [Rhodospirillaceae bacterium]|nr:methyltransferase domain-containing protein [Rhodospirillaceae bacterium]
MSVTRLNIGCGKFPRPGWINIDNKVRTGVDCVADLRGELPFPEASVDYAVAIHVFPHIRLDALAPALRRVLRVLKPGGVFRVALPDLERAIDAYRRGDTAYFAVPDSQWRSLGAKLVAQIVWHNDLATPFTADLAIEALEKAGFRTVRRCAYRETASPFPDIVDCDNRESESFFVEAVR